MTKAISDNSHRSLKTFKIQDVIVLDRWKKKKPSKLTNQPVTLLLPQKLMGNKIETLSSRFRLLLLCALPCVSGR